MKRLELLDNLVVVLEELGAQAVDIVQPFITNIVQIYKYGLGLWSIYIDISYKIENIIIGISQR